MISTAPVEVDAFGFRIQIASESDDLLRLLDRFLFPPFLRIANGGGAADISVRIDQDGGQYLLEINGEKVATGTDPYQLIPSFIRGLDDVILPGLAGVRAVHAGAVQIGNRALLLPGRSHAGKSSLVAELLRRGTSYLSDEYALIDSAGLVHAYPRPMLLRSQSLETAPVLPEELNAPVAQTPVPIGWIMELEFRAGTQWYAPPVSQGQGLMILLRNTPHVLSDAPDLISKFGKATAGAVSFMGTRSDVGEAADHILRIVSDPSL